MNLQTTLKAALLFTILAMFTACSPQTSISEGTTDNSSRTVVTNPADTTSTVLYCNQKSQSGLTAKVMIYTDAANQIRNDYMKVKFTAMPAGFTSGDHIQFFRWQAPANGTVYLDPVPLQARFETLNGVALTNFSPVVYWSQVSEYAANIGITDMTAFLQKVRLVVDVRDPQANFDVLKVAMYNTSGANTVNMDVLMPAFSASPKDYASEGSLTRSSRLQALHPFASRISEGLTATQFQSLGNSFCF